jgi:hypothetical protein
MVKKRTKKNKLKGGAGKESAGKRKGSAKGKGSTGSAKGNAGNRKGSATGSTGSAANNRSTSGSGSAGSGSAANNRSTSGSGSAGSGSAKGKASRILSTEQLNKWKTCKPKYKYCEKFNLVGYCIPDSNNCFDVLIENMNKSELYKVLLDLHNKKETYDNYNYSEFFDKGGIKWRYTEEKKKPKDNIYEFDINNLKILMGEQNSADAHQHLFTVNHDTNNYSIELLGWLLMGLHDQEKMEGIDTSFIKYYFENNGSVKIPIIIPKIDRDNNVSFDIEDGRHRIGLYRYFNSNGKIRINWSNMAFVTQQNDDEAKGKVIDFLTQNNLIILPAEEKVIIKNPIPTDSELNTAYTQGTNIDVFLIKLGINKYGPPRIKAKQFFQKMETEKKKGGTSTSP